MGAGRGPGRLPDHQGWGLDRSGNVRRQHGSGPANANSPSRRRFVRATPADGLLALPSEGYTDLVRVANFPDRQLTLATRA